VFEAFWSHNPLHMDVMSINFFCSIYLICWAKTICMISWPKTIDKSNLNVCILVISIVIVMIYMDLCTCSSAMHVDT
jgi:hypothetical protein